MYRLRWWTSALLALALASALAGCGSSHPPSLSGAGRRAAATEPSTTGWVDQPVTFTAGGITIYATFRHPVRELTPVPAVVLISGSGPTDRNGNTPAVHGSVDTIKAVADWLSEDGVASLRYDKLASGQTGIGPYASDPARIGVAPFEQEAAAALRFLASRPGVDRSRLGVIGHSEGALFTLLLAAGKLGTVPPIHAIGLIEPQSARYLTILATQVAAMIAKLQHAGELQAGPAARLRSALAATVRSLRADGREPADLPPLIATAFPSTAARYLSQADRYDPALLARHLPRGLPVFISCSNDDIQVTCPEVEHLVTALRAAGARTDFAQITGMDHVLKEDTSRTAANYGKDLPFSTELQERLAAWVKASL